MPPNQRRAGTPGGSPGRPQSQDATSRKTRQRKRVIQETSGLTKNLIFSESQMKPGNRPRHRSQQTSTFRGDEPRPERPGLTRHGQEPQQRSSRSVPALRTQDPHDPGSVPGTRSSARAETAQKTPPTPATASREPGQREEPISEGPAVSRGLRVLHLLNWTKRQSCRTVGQRPPGSSAAGGCD